MVVIPEIKVTILHTVELIDNTYYVLKAIQDWIKDTFGSHEEVLKDFRPLYLANRFRAGTSNGVSTSSGYSDI